MKKGVRIMATAGLLATAVAQPGAAQEDLRPAAQLGLRAGKARPPTELERTQSATDIRFVERGLPTNLVPNRDVGLRIPEHFFVVRIQQAF